MVAVCKDHPARDADCEKIRAGNSAAARRVKAPAGRHLCSWKNENEFKLR